MANIPIIIGLDPGTTTAYACIDFNCKVIKIMSSKEFNLSKIIFEISKLGLPLIVSTDKANVPEFIKNFSAKTGAKIFNPKNDLLVNEKREITKNFKTNNDHEMDALASALFAFKKYKITINKIKRYVLINNLSKKIENKLFFYVLLKNYSINFAHSLINKENTLIKEDNIIKTIVNKNIDKIDSRTFLEKINLLNEQINLYENEILDLKQKLKKERKENKKLNKLILKETNNYFDFNLNQKLKKLEKKLFNEKNINKNLTYELNIFNKIILNFNDYFLVKKLNRKNIKYFFENEINNFKIIYLDDFNILNKTQINLLKKNNIILILDFNKNKNYYNLIVFDLKKLNLVETKKYYFILKDDYYSNLSKINLINKVVDDYKAERKENI